VIALNWPQICQSAELGRYLVAGRDLAEGEVLFSEAPLVVGPVAITSPVCLHCYNLVDGSYKSVGNLQVCFDTNYNLQMRILTLFGIY
jgi:hypothetical protein